MEADKIKIKLFLLLAGLVIGIEFAMFAMSIIIPHIPLPGLVLTGGIRIVELGAIIFVLRMQGKGLGLIGLAAPDILPGFKKGLFWSAWFGVFAVSGFVIMIFFNLNPLKILKTPIPGHTGLRILFFLVGGLIGPIVEEVFFRGVVYGFFRKWGVLSAIIISTFFFVILHPIQGIPITQIIGGLVFAVAYEQDGWLMVPITIHITGNLALFSISFI